MSSKKRVRHGSEAREYAEISRRGLKAQLTDVTLSSRGNTSGMRGSKSRKCGIGTPRFSSWYETEMQGGKKVSFESSMLLSSPLTALNFKLSLRSSCWIWTCGCSFRRKLSFTGCCTGKRRTRLRHSWEQAAQGHGKFEQRC